MEKRSRREVCFTSGRLAMIEIDVFIALNMCLISFSLFFSML